MPDWKRADEVPTLTNILKKPYNPTNNMVKSSNSYTPKEILIASFWGVIVISLVLFFLISWANFLGVVGSIVVIGVVCLIYYNKRK